MKKKRIIGITGGVGAGKSTVLNLMQSEFGARVILADLVAHDLMEKGGAGYRPIIEALGRSFLDEAGNVDRKKLAELIFHDDEAKKTVNAIIHPLVWESMKQMAEEADEPLVLIEAAVFDTAPSDYFDEIWYIYAPEEVRVRRLMETRGYSREKCQSIIAGQASESEYKSRSTRVIDNGGTPEETRKQLEDIQNHEIC